MAAAAAQSGSNPASRRLTTIDALRQFPGFYHLQNVLLRGELVESDSRLAFRSDAHEMRAVFADGVRRADGPVELRAQLIDVGRLTPEDPRAEGLRAGLDAERWPRPGEELFLRVTGVTEAQTATMPTVRALALEPWKFEGQKVTLTGNFRGRNLFGDLPGGPGRSRYDFVLRGAEGALWVTGLRPRGRGFDLDVDRRVDTDRWVEVTGTVTRDRGHVLLAASNIALTKAQEIAEEVEEPDAAPVPLLPVEIVFSSPTDGETDVPRNAPIRVQFSRGLDESSLADRVRLTLVGTPTPAAVASSVPGSAVALNYDGATRAIELRFAQPVPPLATVRVEILDGVKGFDGAPVAPWTLTYSVGP